MVELIRSDIRCAGIQFPTPQGFTRSPREIFIPHAKPLEVCFFQAFDVKERIVRSAHRPDQFVELELDSMAIAVLGILNQKNHQECDDRRAGVDDQLPRVAELEYRARDTPDYDGQCGDDERRRMAGSSCRPLGKAGKWR